MGDDVSYCKDLPEEAERLSQPLEVLQALGKKFPTNSVSLHVVQPSRYSSGGYAVYENFFHENGLGQRGDPQGRYTADGLPAANQLAKLLGEEAKKPIILMGFSKGGIVTMQLLAELANLPKLKAENRFKIKYRSQYRTTKIKTTFWTTNKCTNNTKKEKRSIN